MALSLPEERLLQGKTQGFGVEPVSVGVEDDPLSEYRERAKQVYQSGERFSQRERDGILARLVLGL